MRVPQSLRPRLSPSLLILYAIGACGASFPDTAMAAWLNPGGLGMSQARQTLLYATGFATFALKPAYGVLADAFARRLGAAGGRGALYVLAQVGATAGHLALGRGVSTTGGVFAAYWLLCCCQACAELCLSAQLADAVAGDGVPPARAQAEATAARWAGTLASAAAGLRIYRCGSDPPRPRTVISAAAAFSASGALVAAATAPRLRVRHPPCAPLAPGAKRWIAGLALFQGLCLWIGLKSALVSRGRREAWRGVFYALLGALGAAGLAAARAGANDPAAGELQAPLLPSFERRRRRVAILGPALALFAVAATPAATDAMDNVRFRLFFAERPCYTQYLAMLGAAAALAACGIFGKLGDRGGDRGAVGVSVVLAALAALAQAPLARLRPLGTASGGKRRALGGLGRFDAAAVLVSADGFAAELVGLATTAAALRAASAAAAAGHRAAAYGSLLALLDAGAAVSGWISAEEIARAGVTYDAFGRLPGLLRRFSLAALVPLLLVPLLPPRDERAAAKTAAADPDPPPASDDDDDDDEGGSPGPVR